MGRFSSSFWRGETVSLRLQTPSDISMNKLLVITVLVALLALSAESFRIARQAEDEPAAPGPVTQFTDGIKHYYDQTIDTANSYIESTKNLYDETVKAANTYYGIIYDQMYHAFYPQQ